MKFADVLGRFAQVGEESDGGYSALCPAHADSRPSLRIWRGDDNKVRITCRAGCSTESVVKAVGLTWSALFDATGEGLTVPKERPALVGPGPVAALAMYVDQTSAALWDFSDPDSQEARTYLEDRFGLDADLTTELGLGYSGTVGMAYLTRAFTLYPRLTVPLRDFKGVARGLQGRDLSGHCTGRWVGLRNPEGQRWSAYGVFRGQGGYGVTLVTEGPGDALTAVSVGYDAVAVRGASLAGSPELVAELAAGLKGSQVIVAGDNDTAGQSFTRRLADGLAEHGIDVYTLAIPTAGDDLTDWRRRDPAAFPAKLHAAVKAARPVQQQHEAQAAALAADLDDRTGADVVSSAQGREAARVLAGLVGRYGESDAMNAHALVAWADGRIKYAPGLGFYVWNGLVWERSEVKVRQEIHRMGAALVLVGDTQKARGFTMTTRIDALMTELRSVPTVHVDASDFDDRPDLLSFRNGTVDLRTGQLRPHDKRDMLTYCLDLNFREDAECPRWDSFLREIFPENPDLPGYMQRLIGYGITGHTSEQCFAVLWGKGANGKSVLTDTLTAVFRNVSKTTPFATFEEKSSGGIPNDVAALRGSRLVMASEGESGKPMSEAVLKRVTGKDMIAARFLRQEFFEFKPTFLLMLATNHKPKFRGQDEGLWRRVKMIPFQRYFAPNERDYGLDRKLLAEAEGIAAWAVRGAVQWRADGLGDPEVITSASKEYRETSDALAGFLPGTLERCDGNQMSGADAFNKYLEWCEAENLPSRERWTRRTFYDAMEERGITRKKTMHGIALIGVRDASKSPAAAAGPGIFTS
ncbi:MULTISPECIES: phage/plasmid primase, P4 family [unclassified Kitasatospora]|uniref:phage/plasmid primase, P4 family n=1 Tax=unclassified Kitasatospora TaxID=2633591 RepID=UPI002476B5C8|nr:MULTISPECIES: phage/plasmid primase, P4 family [unclassified Kitasatospora]MDH6123835.1 putative DNA primase/helicase [Kitasatospora sp. GP82]MDH6576066.1 putative DNA primase/helicase [Kitasatospora sp. MAP5-34]